MRKFPLYNLLLILLPMLREKKEKETKKPQCYIQGDL